MRFKKIACRESQRLRTGRRDGHKKIDFKFENDWIKGDNTASFENGFSQLQTAGGYLIVFQLTGGWMSQNLVDCLNNSRCCDCGYQNRPNSPLRRSVEQKSQCSIHNVSCDLVGFEILWCCPCADLNNAVNKLGKKCAMIAIAALALTNRMTNSKMGYEHHGQWGPI